MKKLLLGSVALVALGAGAPAIAADFGVAPRAVHYVAGTNWTGCHVGGAVGNEWGRDSGYTTTSASTITVFPIVAGQSWAPGFDMTGFTGGFYAGCDYQFGAWVVGVEGDWSNVNKSGQAYLGQTTFAVAGGGAISVPPLVATEAQERWYATARARLGYAVDKWLLYVTGGAAWAKVDSSAFLTQNPAIFPSSLQSDRVKGYVVGGGIEYDLRYGWSVRSEYLYISFRDYTAFSSPTAPFAGVPLVTNLNTKLNNNVFRFGLSYKFGDWGKAAPVVTK